jgi:AcrR family transcriptional regulator
VPRDGAKVRRGLQLAALELFHERSYDQTTATEIAARAGVTERTFFRHFPDKREALFAGSDDLRAVLVEKILQTPDMAEPLQAVTAVLTKFDWESLAPRDFHRRRHAVIAANPALVERDLMKFRSLANDFTDALRQRGVDADIAQLAARVGIDVFITAYGHWLKTDNKAGLPTISKTVTSLLKRIVPARDNRC